MNKILLLIICCFFSHSIFAQKVISGQLKTIKGGGIPYVNIGIKESKTGTVSSVDGNFSLQIPDSLTNDTLTFSSVGFEDKKISIRDIVVKDLKVVLVDKINLLDEVKITHKKRKTYKLGITGRSPFVSIPASSYQKNDVIEQARLMHLKEPVQVLNANIFVLSEIKEEVKVRINFYALENGLPGNRLVEKSIIRNIPSEKGWHVFDLTNENIHLAQDFVISFEYLPSNRKTIFFAAKLGAADSYLRNNSLGKWRKNMVGGCSIYVTVQN
jgi:hypothetical protein